MRISDWSSDVCSSDLPANQNRPEDAPIGLIPVDALYSPVRKVAYRVENTRVGQVTDYDKLSMDVETDEIGRASCREGVCQNVEISEVAGSLKKKTQPQNTHNLQTLFLITKLQA